MTVSFGSPKIKPMLRSYLRLATRTLRRRLGYTLINGLGLAVALTCAGLVGSYLWFETSYDTFHDDASDIARLFAVDRDDASSRYSRLYGLLGRTLRDQVAGIEHTSALHNHDRAVYLRRPADDGPPDAATGLQIPNMGAFFVPTGDAFLEVFGGFEVIRGDPTVFERPGQALVTASTARRLFGTTDVVGRSVTLNLGTDQFPAYRTDDSEEALTIGAVMADPPAQSHLQFDLVYSVAASRLTSDWLGAFSYFELSSGADRDAIREAAIPVMTRLMGDYASEWRAGFEPLTGIHLYTENSRPLSQPTDVAYLWVLGLLVLVILCVAGINYTNLTAVLYASRSREVGARKALGAHSGQVARQFVVESVVLALLCVPMAVGFASALTPAFNRLMDTRLPLVVWSLPAWLSIGMGALLLGIAASLYPASGVAGRSVPQLFEGSAFGRRRGWGMRQALVVVQFAAFVALGSGAVLMQQQIGLLQTTDLGFKPAGLFEISNGEALTRVPGESNDVYTDQRVVTTSQAFQRELASHPSVQSVSSGFSPVTENRRQLTVGRVGASTEIEANWSYLSPDALGVLGIQPKAGPYFQRPPSERRDSVAVVNRAALDALGCTVERLADCRIELFYPEAPLSVVGVIEDPRFSSLRSESGPFVTVLLNQENRPYRPYHDVFVRFRSGVPRAEQTDLIEATWNQFAPEQPLDYEVITDRIASYYAQDRRLRTLGLGLTGVALVVVVLGLFSMAAYLTRLRLKEVAIRKALGATATSILQLLNREFVLLVAVATAIGSAAGYWATDWWLTRFATRIEISPFVFLAVGVGALTLAVAAVSAQALPAARVDPARVLRSE